MTAPVTVTAADYALLQALDVPASADNLLVAAFHRQQAEAASNAEVAELREALGWYADTFCEGFGDCVGDTCGKWSDDQCSGCKAFAILAFAKSSSEAGGPNA